MINILFTFRCFQNIFSKFEVLNLIAIYGLFFSILFLKSKKSIKYLSMPVLPDRRLEQE